MAERKKISFEAPAGEDGAVRRLAVRPPSADARTQANLHRCDAFGEAVARKVMVKDELENHLRRMSLWDDEKEEAFRILRDSLVEAEGVIARGGVKKSVARKAAIQARGARRLLMELVSPRNRIERNTAEALADQAQFEVLVAYCTTYDDGPEEGKPYFSADGVNPSVDVYRSRAVDTDGRAAAEAFADLYYGEVEESPEEKFLKKYGFADAEGRLVDKQGRFVDADGRPVDEEGYLLGDAESEPEPEFVEFLDDDEDEPGPEDDDAARSEPPREREDDGPSD